MDYTGVLKRIKPGKAEKARVNGLSSELVDFINDSARERGLDAEAMVVGSVAKRTWLSGSADIDIFIHFPQDTSLDELKLHGLALGYECIEHFEGEAEERYASHPYVTGHIQGYDVDFVPCYRIERASELRSAVDRTILHTQYIRDKLMEHQLDDVLLLKSFMKSTETYGSEFRVGGFAGYLSELLVLHYGCFEDVLKGALRWRPGYVIDIEGHGTGAEFTEPLVVVDPTDGNRNVAAALTLQKMSEFALAAKNFLNSPSEDYFTEPEYEFQPEVVKKLYSERGSHIVLLSMEVPKVPADALYPQLKKTMDSIRKNLDDEGFEVIGSDYWSDETTTAIIIFELAVWELPFFRKREGPPIWSGKHADRFLKKHSGRVWVEGSRLMVESRRRITKADDYISDLLSSKSNRLKIGKHIKSEIKKGFSVKKLDDVIESAPPELLRFLDSFMNPWKRLWR